MDGTNVVPQPALAEKRQLEIWLTPHGCLKAALAPGANPIAVERNEQGKGRIIAVSFMALGKYRVQCAINDKNLVDRVQTWFANPVVGDLYYEFVLTNYKDFGGVMLPTNFHAHHDLDDDLEGQGVNVSGGHNSFGLTVSNVRANVAGRARHSRRSATAQGAAGAGGRAEDRRTGSSIWAAERTPASPSSSAITSPSSMRRSTRRGRWPSFAKSRSLIPNKPIRYLVSSHHHWDHLGGLRAYVAKENVTVVLQQNNLPTTRKSCGSGLDAAARYARALPAGGGLGRLHFRGGGPEIRAERRDATMEIYNVQGLQHAQGMVIAYLPQEKIVMEADLFTPPAPNAPMPTTVSASSGRSTTTCSD